MNWSYCWFFSSVFESWMMSRFLRPTRLNDDECIIDYGIDFEKV